MASYTPNYNLKKPSGTDPVQISDINGNMEIIDTQLKATNDQIVTVTANNVNAQTIYSQSTNPPINLLPFTAPCDGYAVLAVLYGGGYGNLTIESANGQKSFSFQAVSNSVANVSIPCFIRKGMVIKAQTNAAQVVWVALE